MTSAISGHPDNQFPGRPFAAQSTNGRNAKNRPFPALAANVSVAGLSRRSCQDFERQLVFHLRCSCSQSKAGGSLPRSYAFVGQPEKSAAPNRTGRLRRCSRAAERPRTTLLCPNAIQGKGPRLIKMRNPEAAIIPLLMLAVRWMLLV